MVPNAVQKRIAMARIEAALIKAGFASHSEVAVRIAGHDPATVRNALIEACRASDAAGMHEAGNLVTLATKYGNGPSHAIAPAEAVGVPDIVLSRLLELKRNLLLEEAEIDSASLGWKISFARSAASEGTGIVLQINTVSARPLKTKPASYASEFSEALGVSVRLEIGQLSHEQDAWAKTAQDFVATGLSIGSGNSSASINVPLRYLNSEKAARSEKGARRTYPFLTAAHPFRRFGKKMAGAPVHQPADNTNEDRVIGKVTEFDYTAQPNASNYFDAAIVEGRQTPSLAFGKKGNKIEGSWHDDLGQGERAYIYAAASGLKPVSIDCAGDTIVTMLTSDGMRVIYRDMIEFSSDEDDDKPASVPGDSGGALLIREGDRYFVAGLIIGGGNRKAKARKPKSYAVPIQRVLERFNVTVY